MSALTPGDSRLRVMIDAGAREHDQYLTDAALLGHRVAWWLAREHQGWSALDELVYWDGIERACRRVKLDVDDARARLAS